MKSKQTRALSAFSRQARIAVALLAMSGLTALGQTIPNPSFEDNSFATLPGYISLNSQIVGWTAYPEERVGLNPASGSPFADNGAIPDGNNVAFIQSSEGWSWLATTISDLTPDTTYKVTFRENSRGGNTPNLKVTIDGTEMVWMTVYSAGGLNAYWYVAFEFTATAATAELALWNDAAGDNTVCVDDFKIAPSTGSWKVAAWTGDEDSGIDANYFYTHAYNFGSGDSPNINGVQFKGVPGGAPAVADRFKTTWMGNVFNGDPNFVGGASATIAKDFVYGGTISIGNYQSITILGLTPGTEYVATIYTVAWEDPAPNNRWATLSVGDDKFTVNQDTFWDNNGLTISHSYVADATGSVKLNIVPINPNNVSFHIYGFSNRAAASGPVAPVVTSQPESVIVAEGQSVTFSVIATGLPVPTYQWRFNGENIPGATESSYTIPYVTAADAGNYDAVASNVQGTIPSNVAKLTVGLPMINSSFEDDLFSVWPGYVSYNWAITGWNAMGGHGINPVTDGTSPFGDNGVIPHGARVAFMQQDGPLSQVVSGFTVGQQYYVHYFENARTGATAPAVEVQVGGVTVLPAHSVSPVGGGRPYYETYSDVFTASAADLELAFVKSAPAGGDCTALIDNVAIVPFAAGTPPFVGLHPVARLVNVGDTVTFSGRGVGTLPITYQWLKDGEDITGETGMTLTLSNIQKADEADYSVRVTNADGHDVSKAAHLTVYEPIPDLFNTGMDDDGIALPDNAVDPHYALIQNPDVPGSDDAITQDTTQFPITATPTVWLPTNSVSKWIGPRFNTAPSAIGLYTYRTVIDLTDRDTSTLIIEGRWATDNTGRGIRVNGVSTDNPQNTAQFASWTPFTIYGKDVALVQGLNTIDFIVENQDAIGYTGLRVEIVRSNLRIPAGTPPEILAHPASQSAVTGDTVTFTAAARGSDPLSYQWLKDGEPIPGETTLTLTLTDVTEADTGVYTFSVSNPIGTAVSKPALLSVWLRPTPLFIGTGVDDAGALLSAEAVDPHFTITLSPDELFPGPDAIVLPDAWPVEAGVWMLNGPSSKWIAPQADQSAGNNYGDYIYHTSFDLTGYDPAQIVLVGGWAVDNGGTDILVNGESSGLTCTAFQFYTPITIASGLKEGVNTLDFLVNNATGDPPAANPTGLRVDLKAYSSIPANLKISVTGTKATVSWLPAYAGQKLQSAPTILGEWKDVVDATNPYTIDITGENQFFRVTR